MADCFEVGEALVDFSIPQVFRDSRLGVNCPRDESAARIFVSFDSHDVVIVFESVDGPPLSRGEIGKGEFSPVGKTAPSVFVLEFGDAHFSTSVGERSFTLRGDIETRDVVDAWLLDRRIPVEKALRRMSFRSRLRLFSTLLVGLGRVGQYFNPFPRRDLAPRGMEVPLHRLWHVELKGLP